MPKASIIAAAAALLALAAAPAAAQFGDRSTWFEPESAARERPDRPPRREGTETRPKEQPRPAEPTRQAGAERRGGEASMQPRSGDEGPADATKPATPPPPPEPPPRPPLGGRKALVPFESSPFPYDGPVPPDDRAFFDVVEGERRGRRSPRTGQVLWEDEAYGDRRVLLYVPRGFRLGRPGLIVLFFHGNGTRLVRDVERRQAVLHQVEAANANAVVVAPQLAVDAQDSSAGAFWRPSMLLTFLEEAAVELAQLVPGRREAGPKPVDAFRHMPVLIVAYSGGYLPAAWVLHHGGADARIIGTVLLDAMYGEQAKFAEFLERRPDSFIVSAYGASTNDGNTELRRVLGERPVRQMTRLEGRIGRGTVTLVAVPAEVKHADFVTQAWTRDPLTDLLGKLPR